MIAPTERCPWRKRVLCGEVHDDNAYAMGGVAGHAGLFASARDVDTLLCRLKACWAGRGRLHPGGARARVLDARRDDAGLDLGAGLGHAVADQLGCRHALLAQHRRPLGFTGTSIWMDLERDRHVILLTNRVHPSRDNKRSKSSGRMIHDLINQALAA